MEYILWWYVITPPSHIWQRRYIRNMEYVLWCYIIAPTTEYLQWGYMEYILWWFVNTSPLPLRGDIAENLEYILWRYRNLSTITHTKWQRPKHSGDLKLAGWEFELKIFHVGPKKKKIKFLKSCLSPSVILSNFLYTQQNLQIICIFCLCYK